MEKCCCGKPATKLFKGQPHCDHCTEILEQMWQRNQATRENSFTPSTSSTSSTPATTFEFWKGEINGQSFSEEMKAAYEAWLKS
jgi:hypothetical protein